MAATLSGNFCTPEEVAQAKIDGTIDNCAFKNPVLGDGYCGNSTRAMCEVLAGQGSGAGDDNYKIYDSDGVLVDHINSYHAMNCLNAGEYGVEDHGAMQYDLKYNRDARFYLARQSTTCASGSCASAADYTVSLTGSSESGSDVSALQAELVQQNAIELYNDDDGGNYRSFFGVDVGGSSATKSPKINQTFVHGTGSVTWGTENPTISMVDNEIKFENLNTCAMQPYGVTATIHEFADPVSASGPGVAGNEASVENVVVVSNAGRD